MAADRETAGDGGDDPLAGLEHTLGHAFADRGLLARALTHASAARTPLTSNERLEFLGDAVLGAAASAALYARHPGLPEGDLTRLKSGLVSRRHCARLAAAAGLEPLIRTGKGLAGAQRSTGRPGRVPASVLSNALEAVVGAVFLDGGYDAAARAVANLLALADPPADATGAAVSDAAAVHDAGRNPKSRLQAAAQAAGHGPPAYELVGTAGPDHAKTFTARAVVAGVPYPPGEGESKKAAEQAAASLALGELGRGTDLSADGAPG